MNAEQHRILVVDDDSNQLFFNQQALQKALNAGSTVNVTSGGEEAIAYLIGEGKFSDRQTYPFPSLVITDLNMPAGDGFHLLEFMQANPGWNVVPKIVLSSSDSDYDVRTAYYLGASVYHLKPATYSELEETMRRIVEYWATAQVPPIDETGRTLATDSAGRNAERYAQPAAGQSMVRPVWRAKGGKKHVHGEPQSG